MEIKDVVAKMLYNVLYVLSPFKLTLIIMIIARLCLQRVKDCSMG